MSKEEKGNRVVVTDSNDMVKRIRTDAEIVKENEELEQALKEKSKKQKLQEILEERNKMRKQDTEEKGDSDMTVMLVEQQDRSVNIGVVGVGQCGSKIAEEFFNRGYNVVAINTAMQDLKHINIPEGQKLFLDYSLGGAAKDLDTGKAAAEEYREEINEHIKAHTDDCDILMLVISGGGGSGSGSAETVVNIMSSLDKPISVLFVMPLKSDDTLSKHNSVQTLARLAKLAQNDIINSLIVVDNARIEILYPGKSMADFWKVANKAIVEPLHLFNQLSASPSEYTSLDPMDFSRLLISESGCSLYGMMEVPNYMEDEAIAEAMINNLETGMLSGDFDLSQTRSAGIIITGSKEALSKVPSINIEYGFSIVSKVCNEGTRIFRGLYEIQDHNDSLKVYGFFSGLGLPTERVNELKAEAEKHMAILEQKEKDRTAQMTINMGKTNTISEVDALHNRIKNKNSAMGKLRRNSKRVIDKRRR